MQERRQAAAQGQGQFIPAFEYTMNEQGAGAGAGEAAGGGAGAVYPIYGGDWMNDIRMSSKGCDH